MSIIPIEDKPLLKALAICLYCIASYLLPASVRVAQNIPSLTLYVLFVASVFLKNAAFLHLRFGKNILFSYKVLEGLED